MMRALILVTLGMIASSCGSAGSSDDIPAGSQSSVAPTGTPEPQTLELSVTDAMFSTDVLEADAGRPIIVAFSNEDSIVHNFQLWRDDSREEKLFFGELLDGPGTIEYEIGALEPGTYRFECHPHVATMFGHLIVAEPEP
ncbi:MAG: cupredoxin domain-containing protein [Chloroflexi bacterium]|nr:cupredoxin domain-containing protein [Chloroflexota bacterium]